MGKMLITGHNKHLAVTVEKGVVHVHVFFRKVELTRVRIRFDAVRFYIWLGRELGVRDEAHHADLQGLKEIKSDAQAQDTTRHNTSDERSGVDQANGDPPVG